MTMISLVERRVFDHFGRDELGIEYGQANGGRVQTSYQPIFAVGQRGQLKMTGLRAGCVFSGDVEEAHRVAPIVAAPLALRNFGYSGSEDFDLYLDLTMSGNWTAQQLLDRDRKDTESLHLLPKPRRVFLEAAPNDRRPVLPGLFRTALVNERPEDELDSWIARMRPLILRFEGKWLASLAAHSTTRILLVTLVATLNRRGVKALFEGLDSDEMVSFAIECGADLAQGDALAQPILAGEYLEAPISHPKVISVDFSRGRKPTVA